MTIVARLRDPRNDGHLNGPAADEIERLRAELAAERAGRPWYYLAGEPETNGGDPAEVLDAIDSLVNEVVKVGISRPVSQTTLQAWVYVATLRGLAQRQGVDEISAYALAEAAKIIKEYDAEAKRLRRGWLRAIQHENQCPVSGGGCLANRCGCVAEMEMLANAE